jgi:membrane dipeptidase
MNFLSRRRFLAAASAAGAVMSLPAGVLAAAPASTPGASAAKAARWAGYDRAIVIDACGAPGNNDNGNANPALDAGELADLRASGLTVINFTVSAVGSYATDFETTLKNIAYWDAQIAAHPDVLLKWRGDADTQAAKASGRVAIGYAFQDATPFGEDLERFDLFHELGVRVIQPTYNRRNLMGDGCLEPGNAGLSLLGRQLVERMNASRTLLDLSHCGQRTTREGIEASKVPVAITHTGCAAVADLPRNKRDEELRLLAQRGGVAGIYFMPYLRTEGQPMAVDVIRHLEHALDVCGEDHVGLGTDGLASAVKLDPSFREALKKEMAERRERGIAAPGERDDAVTFVPDLNTPRRFETLAAQLSARGHSDARIEKILGGNFARLLRDVIG